MNTTQSRTYELTWTTGTCHQYNWAELEDTWDADSTVQLRRGYRLITSMPDQPEDAEYVSTSPTDATARRLGMQLCKTRIQEGNCYEENSVYKLWNHAYCMLKLRPAAAARD